MVEDSDDSSAWLVPTDEVVINEVFIDGFHALYKVQISNLQTQAQFDTGASINAMSFKFYNPMQQQLKISPTNRKVVSEDGDSLGPMGEVHLKFRIGKVVFNDIFIICNTLQCDMILGLPRQWNYRISCIWNQEGKHFLTIKNQFLALSIAPSMSRQLATTKGQYTLQSRSITWISVKTPWNLNINSLFEISLYRQLPKGLIPLDVLHNIKNKQPQELIITILNTAVKDIKLLKNTVLGSITRVDNAECIENICSNAMPSITDRACVEMQQRPQVKTLLLVFPDQSSFQKHAHKNRKSPIQLQNANVPPLIQNKLNEMLYNDFNSIFSKSSTDFSWTNLVEKDPPTEGPPIATKPYTIPLKYKSFVDDEIKHLEDARCIPKLLSNWASPICIMKKKTNPSQPHKPQLQMCIDYRKVNQCLVTAHNNNNGKVVSTFPLPKIQELPSRLNNCKYFSSLDLHSGYCHINLTEDAKKKTAFVTADSKYQWNIVPFGLATTISTFQYLMSKVLTSLNNFTFMYLDDILIFSETYEEHLHHLHSVFEKFKEAGLKIKLSKCQFLKTHLHYLGHRISADGLEPLPEKPEAIKNLAPTKNVAEACQILGLLGYYRSFVPAVSDITLPIASLVKKNTPFMWSEKCQLTLDYLKETFCYKPILQFPDPNEPYILYADISNNAYSGVLCQPINDDNDIRPVT